MALLRDLFSPKTKVTESRDFPRTNKITEEQVRLLLFKETDWRGRKILFDSSTVEKVAVGKDDQNFSKLSDKTDTPGVIEVSDGIAYIYKGPAADATALGEMMFGSVALNCSGMSFKIHVLSNPYRLMCSKVLGVGSRRGAEQSDVTLSRAASASLCLREEFSFSFSIERGDSGYCDAQSPTSSVSSYGAMLDSWSHPTEPRLSQHSLDFQSPPGSRRASVCSGGSQQRRLLRHASTRFDTLLSAPSPVATRTQSDSSSTTCSSVDSAGSSRRKTRLGLAVLITLADQQQLQLLRECAEHSPQLENMFCRLRLLVMMCGMRRDRPELIASLCRAAAKPVQWLRDLLNGPRVPPVWLRLSRAPPALQHGLADRLLSDLCAVLQQGDTKHTKFFVSTLLTHVLTLHLGWVSTVSPYEPPAPHLPRTPYNALCAQLDDLIGNIGRPARAARTVLAGADQRFINRLLAVLAYFIRCGDVTRTTYCSDDFSYGPLQCYNVTSLPVKCDGDECKVSNFSGLNRTTARVNLSVTEDVGFNSKLERDTESVPSLKMLSIPRNQSEETVKVRSEIPPTSGCLKRTASVLPLVKSNLSSAVHLSLSELAECEEEKESKNVLFVLGDDEKLVGLKNKSNNGKSVKKSSKTAEIEEQIVADCEKTEERDVKVRSLESPSRCCSQQSLHSKPIKHSGIKFEFDKYPQIVTNYMKSKNLEILDRHYIGKPGNLKVDSVQYDPTVVPPIQEDRCEICYKCQMMETSLQTPSNASELWSDALNSNQSEPQFARETVEEGEPAKTFVRKRKKNTVVVNLVDPVTRRGDQALTSSDTPAHNIKHLRVIDVGMPRETPGKVDSCNIGYPYTLLGGVTDHYVPDMILQGTLASPAEWESELRRDLELADDVHRRRDSLQNSAIVADCDQWNVRVLCSGGGCVGGGMSALVGSMLDAIPHMRQAKLPAHQCLSFMESKLREMCVLSKSLAELIMSTELCDMATVTRTLSIDVNDVPLLLAVASTHTPHIARRVGVTYR